MAHKKGVGSSRNGRDSNPKYLGVKMYGGQQRRTTEDPGPQGRRNQETQSCTQYWSPAVSNTA